ERPDDRAAVCTVVEAAFGQPDEADLVEALQAAGDAAIALVAERDGAVVGHVMLSPMRAPERCLGLAPVSVAPEHQSAGIGSALIVAGIERARSGGWRGVFVLGHADYYPRFGFSPEAARGFESAFAGPHFMFLALSGDAPKDGQARYAAAFGET
ncbi:MAG TPA: N-acetyltransferase, partial [Reyranella sp.]|nr:N-acetyltransferase [Reyranella sp.]